MSKKSVSPAAAYSEEPIDWTPLGKFPRVTIDPRIHVHDSEMLWADRRGEAEELSKSFQNLQLGLMLVEEILMELLHIEGLAAKLFKVHYRWDLKGSRGPEACVMLVLSQPAGGDMTITVFRPFRGRQIEEVVRLLRSELLGEVTAFFYFVARQYREKMDKGFAAANRVAEALRAIDRG